MTPPIDPRHEQRAAAALRILESVAHVPPATLRTLGVALHLGDDRLAQFGSAFDYFADYVEDPEIIEDPGLAVVNMCRALRRVDHEALLDRIGNATEPPWPALAAALQEEIDSPDVVEDIAA